ncbi:MAG: NADH-quinone oxidoreductase subunit A [Melioribacteraceae bacterium]|nr:NADH-quinone oxidoreductase subunit A [Melioribacteraceae bacterium]
MLTEFGKVFIFILVGIGFVGITLVMAYLVRPNRPTKEKQTTYECGEDPIGSSWQKFNIRFYVVALIFLIFDVEVVMLFPWAIVYKDYGFYGFAVGAIFLIVLFLGMIYEWRKGDLEWERSEPIIPRLNDFIKTKKAKDTE